MSFRDKLEAKVAEMDLTSERRERADTIVEALCDAMEQEGADSNSIEQALQQTMGESLEPAQEIVNRAKDTTS